jgi:hypothetical protein
MRPLKTPDERHDRPAEVRRRNNRIAFNARTQHFGPDVPVPFMCECGDERCTELLRMTLLRYEEGRAGGDFLVAPGHQVDGATIVRVRDGVWLYRAG